MNLRGRLRKAFLSQDLRKSDSVFELTGCTLSELITHLSSLFTEGMSLDNYGQWVIDHIRPVGSFDLTDPEQQRLCFHYTNLQPLWHKDNLKKIKSDKLVIAAARTISSKI